MKLITNTLQIYSPVSYEFAKSSSDGLILITENKNIGGEKKKQNGDR